MIKWKLVFEFMGTIFIPFLYLINIALAYNNSNSFVLPYQLTLLGLLISTLGIILWILSYIHLGRSFGVLPQKQKRVKKGVYKFFAHPMYVAIWLTFLGLSLAVSSWQSLVFLNIVITPLLFLRAHFEEKKLTD